MLAEGSPRSPSLNPTHIHTINDDRSTALKFVMSSLRPSSLSPTHHDNIAHTAERIAPAAASNKSSLAFILAGADAGDDEHDDYMDDSHLQLDRQHHHSPSMSAHRDLLNDRHAVHLQYQHSQLPSQQHVQFHMVAPATQLVPRASFPLEHHPGPLRRHFAADALSNAPPATPPQLPSLPITSHKKGSKFCTVPNCTSRAKHARLCWKHGGSVKCNVAACSNRAKSKGVCWSHGGGTICSFDDCSTISVSNGVCWAHGGGKRCVVDGCDRPSYERTGMLCSIHFANSIV